MANAEAAISVKTVYPDPGALPDFATDFPHLPVPVELLTPHPLVTLAPHTIATIGEVIVTDGAEAEDEFPIDLGGITSEVTAFVLRNNTDQEISISVNDAPLGWYVSPGAVVAYASPNGGQGSPIQSISVIATTTHSGDQSVSFQIFGDPS